MFCQKYPNAVVGLSNAAAICQVPTNGTRVIRNTKPLYTRGVNVIFVNSTWVNAFCHTSLCYELNTPRGV